VRVDGIDTETGLPRPRQLGTYLSKRTAAAAARATDADDGSGSRDTVGWLVRRYVASRTDVSLKTREQYAWTIQHIEAGLGAIRLDRLDREDVAIWIDGLATGGHLGFRSVQVCRNVLRAALNDAVEEGLIRRSPAGRVNMPRQVTKLAKVKEAEIWSQDEVTRFLEAIEDHRFAVLFRIGVLYGLRRSEALALRWDDLDLAKATLRIDEGLIAVNKRSAWSDAKNTRSRRIIPIDDDTLRAFARRRAEQEDERLAAGRRWEGEDLVSTTRTGRPLIPRNTDRALELVVEAASLPRLTSHGLRHTAATHMVAGTSNIGELRAVADILGHSPDMLLRVYAHALPEGRRAIADRIGSRTSPAEG
jgi:integrase